MNFTSAFSLLLLSTTLSYASTLAVYQDQTLYTYEAKNAYIGMTKGVKAKCEGTALDLYVLSACPKNKRLCQELSSLEAAQKELNRIQYSTQALEKLSSLAQPKEIDAEAWISASSRLGEEKANLHEHQMRTQKVLNVKTAALRKQAPSQEVLVSEKVCVKEIELKLPYGYVTFSTNYEAELNKKEIRVTQTMRIVNRSGIDIEVNKAMFYYRSANQYIRPLHFSPWIVNKFEPRNKRRVMTKSRMNVSMADEVNAGVSMSASAPVPRPVASYVDAREYQINDLELPSTGVPVELKITSWSAALACKLKAYPYINTGAFNICSFTPKQQIESHKWKITSDNKSVNENVTGEYHEGKYDLYTSRDEDIQIQRRPIVKKERETGIFGGTERKKDGFILTLTNKSDKAKTLTLIDRIPTSTSDEIKVKLLVVESEKKIKYKIRKEGEIEMQVTLAAKEHKKIEVRFEISYDKDLKISY